MKKKIILIFVSFLILFGFSFSVSAETVFPITIDDMAFWGATSDSGNSVTVDFERFESGYAGIVCGPVGSTCILVSRNTSSGNTPYIGSASFYANLFSADGQYMTFNFYGTIYFNGDLPSSVDAFVNVDGNWKSYPVTTDFRVYHDPGNVQPCYYTSFNYTISFKESVRTPQFRFFGLDNDFVAFNISDAFISVSVDPNGAQVEANSMIADINSVITGSVNTAPLTSGVNNIVGNVTSMIPETTDIPYVSEALGSLTQLTNVAAAEIGGFFDPFFSADMSVTVAGVTFNPFLTFLYIVVVITSFTFAIKIFTRGDHER